MINLKNIKDALTLWRTELDKVERQLEAKLQRLSFLQEAPLPPSEVAEVVIAAMLRQGDVEFHRHLGQKLAHVVNRPMEPADPVWRPGIMGNVTNPNSIDPFCLFYLLREPLTRAITAEIETFDGFPKAGPPRAEREAEILALEQDIQRLRERVAEERQAAQVVGLDVAGLHQRGRIPARPRDLK